MILLDTSVLSLAFRRSRKRREPPAVELLRQLIIDDVQLAIPGMVYQEILSGVRTKRQFQELKASLAGFPVIAATSADHEEAARIHNDCIAGGVTIASVDALVAAQTLDREAALLTLDQDFSRIASVRPLRLVALPT